MASSNRCVLTPCAIANSDGAARADRSLPSHPVEQIQHPLAPAGDRIVRRQQFEPAGTARPLQGAEHDVVRIARPAPPSHAACPAPAAPAAREARNSATRVPAPSCTVSSVMPNRASRLSRKYAVSFGATTSSRSRTIIRAMPPIITPSAQALMKRACARPPSPPNRLGRSG